MKLRTTTWKNLLLGDFLTLKYGKGLPERQRTGGPYPVIGSGGIVGYHSEPLVKGPGIIVGRKGSIGTVHFEKRDFFPIDTVFYVDLNTSNYNIKFIYYLLLQSNLNTLNSDAAVPGLNRDVAHRQPCHVPPLPIQHKIAAILSAYDDLIENNMRRIAILEEMAQAIYHEWFVKFRFPGYEKVKMVDSPMGLMPEGWEVKKLGDIAQQIRRTVHPNQIDPKTPYFGLEHLPRKSIALSEWETAEQVQSTKLAFKKGEILFGKIRPYFHKVGVAPVDGVCSSDAIVISPKSLKHFSIVLAHVSSEEFVNYATQTSQGTKMPRADWNVISMYPVLIPPPPILSRFDEFVQNIVDQIQIMIFCIRNLCRTRDLLLPKLISGEVDVESLDIDYGL